MAREPGQRGGGTGRRLKAAAAALLGTVGALWLALFLLQGRIIFTRPSLSEQRLRRLEALRPHVQEVAFTTPDGVKLRGWLAGSPRQGPGPLVIYFGGNGEEVSWMAGKAPQLAGWSLLLVNYRGFGASEGRPSQRALLRDALYLYDQITRRPEVDEDRVVAMGRSLGCGPAVYLARERAVCGVVLVSPYDSITAVARERFPWLPVRILLRHRFEASAWAAEVEAPMLALVAGDDTIVSPERSLRLAAVWAGEHEVRVLAGEDHVSIDRRPEYWQSIEEFLLHCAAR